MDSLDKLKSMPRYSKGKISIDGLTFHYNDPLAFYNEYRDIFLNKIYDFSPRHKHPVILDIGGYIGLASLHFKVMFPEAKISVFEPDHEAFSLLKKNIRINNFQDISLINAAAGKHEGSAEFFPNKADGGTVISQIQGRPKKIKMVKLSDYIDETIDFMKMNIEGMEGEVLEEIEHKLFMINEMVIEYHAFHQFSQQLGDILNRLDKNGFRYLIADVPCAKTSVPFKMRNNYRNFNLIYAKKMGSP